MTKFEKVKKDFKAYLKSVFPSVSITTDNDYMLSCCFRRADMNYNIKLENPKSWDYPEIILYITDSGRTEIYRLYLKEATADFIAQSIRYIVKAYFHIMRND